MIRILLFAGLSEKAGAKEVLLKDGNGWTVQQLTEWLSSKFPEIKGELGESMVAINEEYAKKDDHLKNMDQVAYIPPVSGG